METLSEPEYDLDEGGWGRVPVTKDPATWRGDPSETLADWTVIVRAVDARTWPGGTFPVHSIEDATSTGCDDGRQRSEHRLGVGETQYNVHKVLLSSGDRASGYFSAQFRVAPATREAHSSKTVMELPSICALCFPSFLDFIYAGMTEFTPETVLPMMELARRLNVPALGRETMKWLRHNVLEISGVGPAPFLLNHAVELRLEKVQNALTRTIAAHFDDCPPGYIDTVPLSVLQELLQDNQLCVENEDVVFDIIVQYMETNDLSTAEQHNLWSSLRFAHLSCRKQIEALSVTSFPRDLFFEDAVACLCEHREGHTAFEQFHATRGESSKIRLLPRRESLPTSQGWHITAVEGLDPGAHLDRDMRLCFTKRSTVLAQKPYMKGIHYWEIVVEEVGNYSWLGVLGSDDMDIGYLDSTLQDNWLGGICGGSAIAGHSFGYKTDFVTGTFKVDEQVPVFVTGSRVGFRLDMGHRQVEYYLEGKPQAVIFNCLPAFVWPAACCASGESKYKTRFGLPVPPSTFTDTTASAA